MRISIKSLLAATAALFASASAVADAQYSAVIAFGDSLSDNGNYYRLVDRLTPLKPQDGSPPLPYFYGRYSNGPVAVELLAANLGVPLRDFAVGGALSGLGNEDPRFPRSGVLAQVQDFTAAHDELDDDALYVVWGGANDFLGAANLAAPGVAQAVITNAIGNLAQSITILYTRGARHFLVPNLPDLGLTPQERGPQAGAASYISMLFNQAMAQMLGGLELQLTHADFHSVDVAALLQSVVANPGAYGLMNVSDPCVADLSYACILTSFNAGPAAGYLFWDVVHPTAAGHALLAQQFMAAVATGNNPPPEPHERDRDWLERVHDKH